MRVLTCGVFDWLHEDHLRLLRKSAEFGIVYVGLLSDDLAGSVKRRPVRSWAERKAALMELPWVFDVVEKSVHDIRGLVERIRPAYLVKGSDWVQSDYYKLNELTSQFMEAHKVTFVLVPSLRRVSTSELIGRVRGS